jgi:hypothetical protein
MAPDWFGQQRYGMFVHANDRDGAALARAGAGMRGTLTDL